MSLLFIEEGDGSAGSSFCASEWDGRIDEVGSACFLSAEDLV